MNRQHGVSLIELILFIVIIGISLVFIASQFANSSRAIPEPHKRSRALALAQGLMDEILPKKWDENTPVGGGCVATASGLCPTGPVAAGIAIEEGSRAAYDDIDDYNAISNQSPPQDAAGTSLTQFQGYSVTVTVAQPGADWNGIPAADLRLVTVTVTYASESFSVQAYRSNF
ncbi:MAG: type II secretion system GspH family protein [Chromatiales bacterium]|nr:type II secretion system GspH family protein [Chromatiales bacterium]